MPSARLSAWLFSGVVTVFLSSQKVVLARCQFLFEEYHVPVWVYLLPVSLSAAWCLAQSVLFLLSIPKLSSKNKAVFITGCDSGFGYHLAQQLSSLGYKVFAGCLFPDSEESKKLRNDQQGISIVPCNITDEASLAEAAEMVTEQLDGKILWAVVANAGIGSYGYLEWIPVEKIQNLFDVNVFGTVRTFKAFAPLLRESRGRLVVTTSWAARFAPPTLVSYSMSKHATQAMCDGLRAELAPFGIYVSSIEPNMYRTSMIPTTTKELDFQWNDLTEEQKNSYGQRLLKRSRIMTQDFSYLCQSDLSFPLRCFEHAISARFPKPSYQCDRFSMWLISKVVSCLPYEFNACLHENVHRLLVVGRNLLPGKYSP